jgi:hypothetical protein
MQEEKCLSSRTLPWERTVASVARRGPSGHGDHLIFVIVYWSLARSAVIGQTDQHVREDGEVSTLDDTVADVRRESLTWGGE